jgi:hypothetical protein
VKIPRALAEKWERILAAEGLAPIDEPHPSERAAVKRPWGWSVDGRQRIVVRTEIVTPRPMYVPEPVRLAEALEAWLEGDASHFTDEGIALLSAAKGGGRRRLRFRSIRSWPRRRARVLAGICRAMAEGQLINECARKLGCSSDLAYVHLRRLYAALSDRQPQVDDDDANREHGD